VSLYGLFQGGEDVAFLEKRPTVGGKKKKKPQEASQRYIEENQWEGGQKNLDGHIRRMARVGEGMDGRRKKS